MILSRITLLIFPIFDLEGFIKRHEILFGKSSLWSFIVIYVSVFYRFSILSDVGSFSVTLLGWLFTLFTFCRSEFLHVFVIFSSNSFLYLLWPICIRVGIYLEKRILCHCFLFPLCHCLVFLKNCYLFFWIRWFLSLVRDSFENLIVLPLLEGILIYWFWCIVLDILILTYIFVIFRA